jgi:inner membrane protein
MDSLTQMVLGAAVGEATLGKKVGNRAMMWGAVAGTLPDLDVIANFFMSPIDALAFHRGITHAAIVCLFGALIWVG